MPLQSEGTAAQKLRLLIVQEHSRRKSEIEPFIAGITDDWDGYLKNMANPNVWGGEPEIVMAMNVIKRPITVYRVVQGTVVPIVTYGEELPAAPLHLLWRGVHYDLLVEEKE